MSQVRQSGNVVRGQGEVRAILMALPREIRKMRKMRLIGLSLKQSQVIYGWSRSPGTLTVFAP